MAEQELTAKQASLTAVGLVLATTVGLVGASVSTGTAAAIWAIGTVVVISALAFRLRRAPTGTVAVTLLITGILVLSAGLPTAAVLSESRGVASGRDGAQAVEEKSASPVADATAELRRALTRADELLPNGSNSLLDIRIDENSTQVTVLDLAQGQAVYANYSQSSERWYDASRRATNDRADAAFRRADIAGLDLTAAAKTVTAAADRIGVDRSSRHASDGIEIDRRSSDKLLVSTFSMSGVQMETDGAGRLPDNLALATVDGLLPIAERLLRTNGLDPTASILDRVEYRSFAPNSSSLGASDRGSVELSVRGAGVTGSLIEEVGRFPEVRLTRSPGSASTSYFALGAITAAGIEKARADVEQRFSVLPIDAHAVALSVTPDSRFSSRRSTPVMEVGLGPSSKAAAYYALDGAFVRTD